MTGTARRATENALFERITLGNEAHRQSLKSRRPGVMVWRISVRSRRRLAWGALPAIIEPALAIEKVPGGQRWIHEIKLNG